MTIRALHATPLLQRPKNVSCELSPQAVERWQSHTFAAATDNNVISIMDVIGQDYYGQGITANRVSGALRAIGNKDVVVEINSPGGDFFEGLAIYNVLREHPKKVTVKVLGTAASAASIVAMAGDDIMVGRAGFMMIHCVWVIAIGNKSDLRSVADSLEPFDAVAADVYEARTGLTNKEIVKMLDAETWIGGSECVDLGFADSLLPSDEVRETNNMASDGPIAAARRIEAALEQGIRLPRSERRRLIKELIGKPGAAEEDGTPSATSITAVDIDGTARLRLALAGLTLATASP